MFILVFQRLLDSLDIFYHSRYINIFGLSYTIIIFIIFKKSQIANTIIIHDIIFK
jgi:hypothetical protein